jgi:hypothetical protein
MNTKPTSELTAMLCGIAVDVRNNDAILWKHPDEVADFLFNVAARLTELDKQQDKMGDDYQNLGQELGDTVETLQNRIDEAIIAFGDLVGHLKNLYYTNRPMDKGVEYGIGQVLKVLKPTEAE